MCLYNATKCHQDSPRTVLTVFVAKYKIHEKVLQRFNYVQLFPCRQLYPLLTTYTVLRAVKETDEFDK
jgi:hypothetical protein